MANIPSEAGLDHSLALLRDGYTFISKRCERYRSDLFQTRLMFRNVICMMGSEAAQEFYAPNRFTRRGAMPKTTLWLLQDTGSALTMDGAAHNWRKQIFMALMNRDSLHRATDMLTEQWYKVLPRWDAQHRVVLLEEMQEILCRTICQWSGVPLEESESKQRTREMVAMIEGAGSFGARNIIAQRLRARSERWI